MQLCVRVCACVRMRAFVASRVYGEGLGAVAC